MKVLALVEPELKTDLSIRIDSKVVDFGLTELTEFLNLVDCYYLMMS